MLQSIVKFSQLEDRLDAEYYKPEFLDFDKKIIRNGFWPLKDLVAKPIVYGHTPSQEKESYIENGIIFIRSAELNDFFINTSNSVRISQKNHEKLNRSKIVGGDVVLATVGATIGACGIVPYDIAEANCNQAVAVIHPKSEIPPEFLAMVLTSGIGQLQIKRFSSGGARENLDPFEVKALKIPKISSKIIKDISQDIKLSYQKRQLAQQKYQEAKKSLEDYLKIDEADLKFQKTFSAKFSDMEDRFDAEYYQPKFIKVFKALEKSGYKLEKLGDIVSGVRYGTSEKVVYQKDGVPFLRVTDVDDFYTIEPENGKFVSRQEAEKLKQYAVKKGEIIISRTGTLGSAVYIDDNLNGSIFGSYFIKVLPDSKELLPEFVAFYLNSLCGKMQTEKMASGGIQTNITVEMVKSYIIPVLNKKVQENICNLYFEALSERRKSKQLLEQAKIDIEKNVEKGARG